MPALAGCVCLLLARRQHHWQKHCEKGSEAYCAFGVWSPNTAAWSPPPLLLPSPPSLRPLLLSLLLDSLLRALVALPGESSVRGRRRVMRRRGSGAKAARAPVAVPTRKHCSGVSAIAVIGPWLTSYVSTTCVSAQHHHGVLPFVVHVAMQAGSQQLRTSNQGQAQMEHSDWQRLHESGCM